MRYPLTPKSKRLNVKLTDEQIQEIRKKHEAGATMNSLAKDYKVTVPTIFFHCLSEEKRTKLMKERHEKYGKNRDPEKRRASHKKTYQRKKEIMGEDLSKFWKSKYHDSVKNAQFKIFWEIDAYIGTYLGILMKKPMEERCGAVVEMIRLRQFLRSKFVNKLDAKK